MASSRVVSFSDRPTVVSAARQTAVSVRPTMPVLLSPTVQVPQTNTVTQYTPPKWTAPATNSDIINAIADCMNKPPTNIDENYMLNAMWVAEYLNVGATTETSAQLASNTSDLTKLLSQQGGTVTRGASTTPSTWLATTSWAVTIALAKVVVRPTTNPQMSVTTPVTWVTNESGRSVANQSVANVLAFIQRAEDFLSQAAADGFAPPDNPFTVIATLNANRKGQFTKMTVDSQQADDLVYNIKVIVDLLEAQNQGGIDLTTGRVDAAQMSHLHLSFDGLGGSGNPAADILKFLPSVDDVKRATEESTLSVLDFSLRVPYLLFTMEYRPVAEEPPVGTLVGFKRIADASGYIITRRDVFTQQEVQFTIDNATITAQSKALLDYVKTFGTTFFNDMDDSSVFSFLDSTTLNDEFYLYRIQAYQVRSENQMATFSVQSSPVALTTVAKNSVKSIIVSIDPSFSGTNSDTISPWPAMSQYLYGTSNYDWILAAVNTRASINRSESRATTRSYSYLNSQVSFLFSQADAGKLVKPGDVNDVVNRVNDSIQKFGVQQTVQNLLDETGISYYFEGRDAPDSTSFHRAGTQTTQTSNLFAVIGASIDPDTAILDLKTLSSNMYQLLGQNLLSTSTKVQPGSAASNDAKPVEISVPDPDQATSTQAEGDLQFVNVLGDMKDPHADLTTFDGLSKLMRVIRILSDFGPNRVVPKAVTTVTASVPAPVSTTTTTSNKKTVTATPVIQKPVVYAGASTAGWWDFSNAGSSGSPTWRTGTPPPGAKTSR